MTKQELIEYISQAPSNVPVTVMLKNKVYSIDSVKQYGSHGKDADQIIIHLGNKA